MKILKTTFLSAAVLLLSTASWADTSRTASKEGASVYIISPADGETVSKNFTVKFGLQGMGVAPAGTEKAGTGHHHLLIDGKALPPMDKPMGKDGIKHFGGGQTEAMLSLDPGKHSLQLVLGDKSHVPHDPPLVSQKITIMVK
ncbi:MAG: DUF4399 domain-containing protein [Nitrospiria bacterium]